MIMSRMPAARASSTPCWMSGLSTGGSISLGDAFVARRNTVAEPPARKTAPRNPPPAETPPPTPPPPVPPPFPFPSLPEPAEELRHHGPVAGPRHRGEIPPE